MSETDLVCRGACELIFGIEPKVIFDRVEENVIHRAPQLRYQLLQAEQTQRTLAKLELLQETLAKRRTLSEQGHDSSMACYRFLRFIPRTRGFAFVEGPHVLIDWRTSDAMRQKKLAWCLKWLNLSSIGAVLSLSLSVTIL
jgi:hypothetical protein